MGQEALYIEGLQSPDRPLGEDLLGVRHRLGIARNRSSLRAFEAEEPLLRPDRELDVALSAELALVNLSLDLGEGSLGELPILADPLAVELPSLADDDVVGRPAGAGAALALGDRRPRLPEGAGAGVSCLETCHQPTLGRTTLPPPAVSITSSGAPPSQASSSSSRRGSGARQEGGDRGWRRCG